MSDRTRFQGVLSVVRFNWPFYAIAVIALLIAAVAACFVEEGWIRNLALVAFASSLWFLAGSLAVSFWVYDCSALYRWDWLLGILSEAPPCIAVCHTGFDEVSASIRRLYPGSRVDLLDHYDPGKTSEPSIARARELHPPPKGTVTAPFDRWPDLEADLVLGVLAIHELRSEADRTAWFREARRALAPGGRVVVVEHVRDAANFLAFGPGSLHFHSATSWRRAWESAGLSLSQSLPITPFLRVFVLEV